MEIILPCFIYVVIRAEYKWPTVEARWTCGGSLVEVDWRN